MSHHHSSNNVVTMSDGTQVNLGSDTTGAQNLSKEVAENNKLKMELSFLEGMEAGRSAGGGSGGFGGNYANDVIDPFSGSNRSTGNHSLLSAFQDINGTVSSVGSQLSRA